MKSTTYPTDKSSRFLYKAGGITAILFLIYCVVTILIFILISDGYPETASECFAMLKENKFTGLLRLDIVSVIIIPFYYLLFYSIYQSLKTDYKLISKVALFCTLAGVTVFISGVNIASIINLNDKYQLAATTEYKQQLLTACEAMLAEDMWINTGAIIRGILIETGALIFSIIMLKTLVFNKITGWIGILTHGFDLSSIIIGLFIPMIKEIFTMVAGPLYIIWFILIGIRLLQLSRINNIK